MFEFYSIPSGSMEKTIQPGDIIIVDKITLGMERPRSFLDLAKIGMLIDKIDGLKQFCEQHILESLRLPGFRKVQRNDVLVFHSPMYPLVMVKRIVDCAGDTVEVNKGKLLINQQPSKEKNSIINEWYVFMYHNRNIFNLLDSLDIKQTTTCYDADKKMPRVGISNREIELVRACSKVDSVVQSVNSAQKSHKDIYPKNSKLASSKDYWGPIVVPRKGLEIKLTSENLMWYQINISRHEHHKLVVKNDSVFIDGYYKTNYVFEQDYYYFAMGDNRHSSYDSRYLGFVPFDHVIGKARRVFVSFDPIKNGWNSWRWYRTLKKIH